MTTFIIHHNDLDGYASAGIARAFLAQDGVKALPIEMAYGQTLPDRFGPEDTVYMLDFALQPLWPGMDLLGACVAEFIWIDHHKSALEAYQVIQAARGNGWGIEGLRLDAWCAAELTWAWFTLQDQALALSAVPALCAEVPPAIKLVGDWDTWRHVTIADSVAPAFKLAFDMHTPVEVIAWFEHYATQLLDHWNMDVVLANKINQGIAIQQYEQQTSAALMRSRAFEAQLAVPYPAPTRGQAVYTVIAANFAQKNSQAFASVYDPGRHALMLGFAYENTDKVTVSLYSTNPDFDCGDLAKRCGEAGPFKNGGGSAQAGGFQTSWAHLWTLLRRVEQP